MARPIPPTPDTGTVVKITTMNCVLDEPAWLIITQNNVTKYGEVVKVNQEDTIHLPGGSYRFNFHFQKIDARSNLTARIQVPSTGKTFPLLPRNGTGGQDAGKPALVSFNVVV